MTTYDGESSNAAVPGIKGKNTAANGGVGVYGESQSNNGVLGLSHHPANAGVSAINDAGGFGLWAETKGGQRAAHFQGNVECQGGVFADSQNTDGVFGKSHNKNNSGVAGVNEAGGVGVYGIGFLNDGVQGTCRDNHSGVAGINQGGGSGVYGTSTLGDGVQGHSGDANHSGVAGINDSSGVGVYGRSAGGPAGRFDGNVTVTGQINGSPTTKITCFDVSLIGGDCAEEFDVANAEVVEPGTVMVLGEGGILEPSQFAYDKRVAGVISGAGDYKPGIVLDKQKSDRNRQPVALLGKVFCKVDVQYGAIEVGDLLTTSPTPGRAMKATDQLKAFGAVIGKALRPLKDGQGLIPILISLQ